MEKEMFFVGDHGGNWQSVYLGELNSSSEQLRADYYDGMERTGSQFESVLSSMGSLYNGSGEISTPLSCSYNNNNSTTTSCYSTPLSSPHKFNLGAISLNARQAVAPFPSDPGSSERAAVNSCLARLDSPYRCLKKGGAKLSAPVDEEEFSSISGQFAGENAIMIAKKRKTIAKNKAREKVAKDYDRDAKKSKPSEEDEEIARSDQKPNIHSSKPPEPPKDYIHVRARRGQATDSHSLAERVRREKISERMKVLQDLVPGCSKVTGKAIMLDEIINYVQSLQRQVEFLSMKLTTVNFNSNLEAFLSKQDLQFNGSSPQTSYPLDLTQAAYQFVNLPKLELFQNGVADSTDVGSQFPGILSEDFQTVLQTGYVHNSTFASQNYQCTSTDLLPFSFLCYTYRTMIILISDHCPAGLFYTAYMKIELPSFTSMAC